MPVTFRLLVLSTHSQVDCENKFRTQFIEVMKFAYLQLFALLGGRMAQASQILVRK
jgi:hypothetical protein